MIHSLLSAPLIGVDTTTVTDTRSTLIVQIVSALLLLLGVILLAITVWYWKSTRPDPEALAALVTLSQRKFVPSDTPQEVQLDDPVQPEVIVEIEPNPQLVKIDPLLDF